MAGTKALLASIGASVVLVATAALSLLAVSAVFAFGGWVEPASSAVEKPALVFAGSNLSHGDALQGASAGTARIVAPAPKPQPRRDSHGGGSGTAPSSDRSASSVVATEGRAASNRNATAVQSSATMPAPAAARKQTAQHVRAVGNSLGSTVEKGGTAVSRATQPLAPPVSAAVQQVLNVVAEIVRRTTAGAGTALETLPAPAPK